MTDEFFNKSFYEKYGIATEEYRDLSILSFQFSVRTTNCLMRSGITTVGLLLETTPDTLKQIKGFGKGCFDELEIFLNDLKQSGVTNINSTNLTIPSSVSAKRITKHFKEILTGDFSVFKLYSLTTEEKALLQKYKDAYYFLGKEISSLCIDAPEEIAELKNMFNEYQSAMKNTIEIHQLLSSIPCNRKNNKAYGYINAFTLDEEKRSLLKEMYGSDECALNSLANTKFLNNEENFQLLKRFLNWCAFDLRKEVSELLSKVYSKDQLKSVILLRAENKTLAEIGNTLGFTRERARQIELKAKTIFAKLHGRIRIISKISAERNGDTLLSSSEIEEYFGSDSKDILFFLQNHKSPVYTYDRQLDMFILDDDSLSERVQNFVENLPDFINSSNLHEIFEDADNEGIPKEAIEKAFYDTYQLSGEVFHRHKLSLTTMYERVVRTYYPNGIKIHDPEVLRKFKDLVAKEYGDIKMSSNDRAIVARVSDICMLCGRGEYRPKQKDIIPKSLANKIYDYIISNENPIFLTNTIFDIFKLELLQYGVDNKYFLQGLLKEWFGDTLIFRRDYISKDANITSIYSSVVNFIKKHDYPVSKAQIKEEFQGITDIVTNFATEDADILNYFGKYIHASKLIIYDSEKEYLFNTVNTFVADAEIHHFDDLYNTIVTNNPEVFTRNGAMNSFSAYSIVEHLFSDNFQFSRPLVAKLGTEITNTSKRLRDLIYSKDEITVDNIQELAKENHLSIQSLLNYVNDFNDEFLLINGNTLMKISKIGVDEDIAVQVDCIISDSITETTPIRNLSIWANLPQINISWSEWLVYSILNKWGKKTLVATSSNQLRFAVPLVAPIDNYDPTAFENIKKDDNEFSFEEDDLNDLDALLEDFIDLKTLEDN